jgi:CubicO group peptidase (beta-lactamase class C family)
MTSICAIQLVERGLVTLDEPVCKYIPELKDFPILKSFTEDGKPVEEPHTKPITLRLLLTHQSGLSYDATHPKLMEWMKVKGLESSRSGKLLERFNRPMVFEPGEGWMYGPSIDYAGLLIERITGGTLEDYMKKNLWEPLGVKDMTFYLSKRPDLKARMAEMTFRDEETSKVRKTDMYLPYQNESGAEVEDCMGGQSVFTSPSDYLKVLQALLTTDENEKILKKETVEMFFSPQLTPEGSSMINAILQDDMTNNAMGGTPKEMKKDWGLGGLLLCGDSPDGKKEGTMLWGGLPNLIWVSISTMCDIHWREIKLTASSGVIAKLA